MPERCVEENLNPFEIASELISAKHQLKMWTVFGLKAHGIFWSRFSMRRHNSPDHDGVVLPLVIVSVFVSLRSPPNLLNILCLFLS
jgi:hypothetical protein